MHDSGDAIDMDAACGHIGGDERIDLAVLEGGEGTLALALRAVTVDGRGADAGRLELASDAIGTALGATEHDGRAERR